MVEIDDESRLTENDCITLLRYTIFIFADL